MSDALSISRPAVDGRYYIDLEDAYGAKNYKPLDVVLTRGEGIWVWDTAVSYTHLRAHET